MKAKNWITQDWAKGAILCATLGILFTMGYDYFKNKPMLSTIWQIVKGFWNFIISALTFNLKVWWLITLIVIIVIIYKIANFKPEEAFRPDFCNYREGRFKQWRWSWNWKWSNSERAWGISDLTAHCPTCDTPLIKYTSFYDELKFDCPRCDFRANDVECEEPHKIERIVMDNIDRKNF